MPASAAADFTQLVADEWEQRLERDPITATLAGDHRYDDRLPRMRDADFAAYLGGLRDLRARLGAIDPAALDSASRLNYSIFRRYLDGEIGELDHAAYRIPLSRTSGFHTFFPELHQFVPLVSVSDYQRYLARLEAIPTYIAESTDLMRLGLATGYAPSRPALAGVPEAVLSHVVDEVQSSAFYWPFASFPATIPDYQRDPLRRAGASVITSAVVPAYQNLHTFLAGEYMPAARDTVGAWALPRGLEFYAHRIRYFTSLDLAPDAIHATGQAEVRRIRAEMHAAMQRAGFSGDLPAFVEFLRTDARFYAATPEGLLKEVALVLKRMDGELPRLFGVLPRMPYGIRAIPDYSAPGNTTAYYFPPAGDGSRAGTYYVNTHDLPSRPLYEIEALSFHEAVPGHHLQIALQQELGELPAFRRFGSFTAYIEGWALYAERLGLDLGFYQDPYSDFGRLSFEMWRACRLVVDTGLHALGWTRQQAIDFMAANTSLSLLNIANEVDRYIAWPGQALAYKIGELKIRELRARAEAGLGPAFDVREFHAQLLGNGSVPLDVLEADVDDWIASRRPAARPASPGEVSA